MRNDYYYYLCEEKLEELICWVASILALVWMVLDMRTVQTYSLVCMKQLAALMVLNAILDLDMSYDRPGFGVHLVDHPSKTAHPFS